MFSQRLIGTVQLVIIFILLVSASKADINAAGPLHAKLIVRGSYLSGTPVLVRVEVVNDSGKIERGLWDAEASLLVNNPNVNLSPNKVVLYNGLGSTPVKFTGSGNFMLTAKVNGMEVSRQLLDLQGKPITEVSGELTGDTTIWSGIIHITGNVIVPIGHTLTIQPDTLVLINGVGSGTNGTNIEVRGKIESLGTINKPVTFTAFDPTQAWGQIRHINAAPSSYQYTDITRGGHSPGMGHTGAGPVIYPENSQINFDYCSLTDNDGKIMYARGSDLTFRCCHFARSVMGPEIEGTGLLFEDGFINEMFGSDDNDGIYLIKQRLSQNIELRRGVIANCDDDGVDTLNSNVLIEDFIIRDCYDKGVSANGGEQVRVNHALIINNGTGVAAKEGITAGNVHVYIDNTTIVSANTGRPVSDIGIHSYIKYATTGVIESFITNSIILAANPVKSDFTDPDPLIRIDYSNVAETWSGTGNINADPCFADPNNGDYHLKSQAGRWDPNSQTWVKDDVTSPCINAGDPASPIGLEPFPNGGIINMGAYGGTVEASKSYFGKPPCETIVAGDINGDCVVNLVDFALIAFHWLEER